MAVMESTVRLITTITVLTFASSLVAGGTGHAGTVEAVMPSPPIDDRSDTCHSHWLAGGLARARVGLPDCPQSHRQSGCVRCSPLVHPRRAHPCFAENRPQQPLLTNLV